MLPYLHVTCVRAFELELRTGLCCHGILQAAFQAVFSKESQRPTDASLLRCLALEDEPEHAVEESPFVFPEVPVQKVQGVRAGKSQSWLQRPTTVVELMTSILTTEPVFKLSTWLLQQQEDECWLSKQPEDRPMVNLVTARYSPVMRAIADCLAALQNPLDVEHGPLFLLDRSLFGSSSHNSSLSCEY